MTLSPPPPGVARDPPQTSRNIPWCCELIDRLISLWTENRLSTWQMAKQLGVSRNALLGKVHRLGLPTHKKLPQPRKAIPAPRPPPPPIIEEPAPAEPKFLGLSLMQLRTSSCRYPRGEAVPFSFCGQRKQDGSSYCPYHHRMTHVPVSARRAISIPSPWNDYRPSGAP